MRAISKSPARGASSTRPSDATRGTERVFGAVRRRSVLSLLAGTGLALAIVVAQIDARDATDSPVLKAAKERVYLDFMAGHCDLGRVWPEADSAPGGPARAQDALTPHATTRLTEEVTALAEQNLRTNRTLACEKARRRILEVSSPS
jgi:hypothetical protein